MADSKSADIAGWLEILRVARIEHDVEGKAEAESELDELLRPDVTIDCD